VKSEALCALDMLEKLGAANCAEEVRRFLRRINRALEEMGNLPVILPHPDESDSDGESLARCYLSCVLTVRVWAGSRNLNDGSLRCNPFANSEG
jgi:hypothetical protein